MKRLIALIAAFATMAPAALAASASLKVSPATVIPGVKVKVSGSVGGCQGPVTIYSRAFKTKHKFAGVPSVNAPLKQGKFSVKVKVKQGANGSYKVSGRCGGSRFAKTTLNVQGY